MALGRGGPDRVSAKDVVLELLGDGTALLAAEAGPGSSRRSSCMRIWSARIPISSPGCKPPSTRWAAKSSWVRFRGMGRRSCLLLEAGV